MHGEQKENGAGTRRWKGIRGAALQLSSGARLTAAMLHDPTMSSFGVYSGHPFRTRPDWQRTPARTIAYVLYAIVFRETCGRHTRTLLAALSFLLGPTSRDNALPPSSENSTRVTLHLARVHSLAALVSSERHTISSIPFHLPRNLPFFALCLFYPPILCSPCSSSCLSSFLLRSSCSFARSLLRFNGGMEASTRTRRARPSCRAIVRPLSTQPRQIRFGMVFSATMIRSVLRGCWSDTILLYVSTMADDIVLTSSPSLFLIVVLPFDWSIFLLIFIRYEYTFTSMFLTNLLR